MTMITRYLTGFMIGFLLHTAITYSTQGKDIFYPVSICIIYLIIFVIDIYQQKNNKL